jgi:MscS family membrane protein
VFLSTIFYGLSWISDILPMPARAYWVVYAVLKTLSIWVWSSAALQIGAALLDTVAKSDRAGSLIQPRTMPVFEMLTKVLVIAVAVYFMFLAWDIDLTAWLASAGIIGIAVGFAAKDTLANLFSGLFIIADAPYQLGEYIRLDGGLRGMVTAIGIRSTRILTRDDVEITVPNSLISNSKIVNESGGPHVKQRLRIKVDVAYGSDIKQVRETLMSVAKGPEVCRTPAPRVRFRRFGDSGLAFELLFWIGTPDVRGRVLDRLNGDVYDAFLRDGIEIPFAKQDLYIKEMPERKS